ncbi:MAG: hypothetical protein INR62_05755 [Rhodospirillales bacterium]|nr:hypothetical protein [Acetobacter sp.]
MKQTNELVIPVGVSLTHDKGHPVLFAYVGGGRGRLGMKAKRFNPRTLGGMEKALKQAIRWRKQALKEHTAAVAALPPVRPKRKAAKAQPAGRKKRTA